MNWYAFTIFWFQILNLIFLSESTHIRILIFSKVTIRSCTVKIEQHFEQNCKQVNEHLFVVSWNPSHYRDGLHYITVTVIDTGNHEKSVTQPFRLDGKQSLHFDTLASFVLHTDFMVITERLFWFSFFLCVAPLIFFRVWHELVKGKRIWNCFWKTI